MSRYETDEDIIVREKHLLEFLPIQPLVFNNSWTCERNEEKKTIEIVRTTKFGSHLALAIFIIVVPLIAAVLSFFFTPEPGKWLFIGACLFISVCFLAIIPVAIGIGRNREDTNWPDVRFSFDGNSGEITVFERITYTSEDYDKAVFGVVAGYFAPFTKGRMGGGASSATQLFLAVHLKDGTWRRHILAHEGFGGHLRNMTKLLSETTGFEARMKTLDLAHSQEEQFGTDMKIMRKFNTQAHRYVGIISD